eukprot:gene57244-biopygen5105
MRDAFRCTTICAHCACTVSPMVQDATHEALGKRIDGQDSERAMPSYKLTYFGITGLGEPIRMAFTLAGVAFEDERIGGEEWQKRKAELGHQMPTPRKGNGSGNCAWEWYGRRSEIDVARHCPFPGAVHPNSGRSYRFWAAVHTNSGILPPSFRAPSGTPTITEDGGAPAVIVTQAEAIIRYCVRLLSSLQNRCLQQLVELFTPALDLGRDKERSGATFEGAPLYPTDAWAALKADEIMDLAKDMHSKIFPTFRA